MAGIVRIENWSVGPAAGFDDPYLPPEMRRNGIVGRVYGHHRKPDGDLVRTSPIVDVDGCVISTQSGTTYMLGEPDPLYLKWLREHGHSFNPCDPIRMIWLG